MRICHYIASLTVHNGGLTAHVVDLALMTARLGCEVTVVVKTLEDAPETITGVDGLRVVELGPPAGLGPLLSKAQLNRAIELLQASDVAHLHSAWDPVNEQIARRRRPACAP